MTPGNFSFFLPQLVHHDVQFVLIGGGAAIAHGLARATYDVDIIYSRQEENLAKLVAALEGIELYYRGAPPGLPFRWDRETLRSGLNFTFTSTKGDIDLLGEAAGQGTWEGLRSDCETMLLYGCSVRVVTLERLIQLKRAAGRPKDFETIAQLEALREERSK